MRIVVNKHLLGEHSHHVRVRTHKNKRIDKKYLKMYGYRSIKKMGDKTFVMDNAIFMCPITYRKIKDLI